MVLETLIHCTLYINIECKNCCNILVLLDLTSVIASIWCPQVGSKERQFVRKIVVKKCFSDLNCEVVRNNGSVFGIWLRNSKKEWREYHKRGRDENNVEFT